MNEQEQCHESVTGNQVVYKPRNGQQFVSRPDTKNHNRLHSNTYIQQTTPKIKLEHLLRIHHVTITQAESWI